MFFPSILVRSEGFHLLTIHMLGHLVRLPFLESKSQPLVTVVLIIGLILVVLDSNEITVYSFGVEGKSNKGIDCCGLRNDFEGPGLP